MKINKLLIGLLIILNILLLGFILSFFIRFNEMENQLNDFQVKLTDESESVKDNTDEEGVQDTQLKESLAFKFNAIEEQLENYQGIEERLNLLESNGDVNLDQRVKVLEDSVKGLFDLLKRQNNVSIIYGSINSVEVNDSVALKINIIDQDQDINVSDSTTLEVSNDFKAFLYSEIGLVEAETEDFLEKVRTEVNENFEDDYTFIIIDEKIVQIYQGNIK